MAVSLAFVVCNKWVWRGKDAHKWQICKTGVKVFSRDSLTNNFTHVVVFLLDNVLHTSTHRQHINVTLGHTTNMYVHVHVYDNDTMWSKTMIRGMHVNMFLKDVRCLSIDPVVVVFISVMSFLWCPFPACLDTIVVVSCQKYVSQPTLLKLLLLSPQMNQN